MARILVIDDEPHIRIILQEFLTRKGHEVVLAEDGKAGIKLVRANVYDLVITDILMPEKDGFEVIMELKQIIPLVRIIVITGGGDRINMDDLLNTARLMGADRVLSKPVDLKLLHNVVQEVLAAEADG